MSCFAPLQMTHCDFDLILGHFSRRCGHAGTCFVPMLTLLSICLQFDVDAIFRHAILCTSDDEPPARKVGSKNRTRRRDPRSAPAKKKKLLKKVPANDALAPASKEPTDFQRFRSLVHKRIMAGLTARSGGGTVGEGSRHLAGW